MEDYDISNSNVPHSITATSIDSLPEITKVTQFYFKIYFILISIVSFILGLKIIYERDNYLIKEFEEYNLLYIFIIIYTFGFFSALILSFVISFLIYLISKIIFCFKKRKEINNELDLLIEEDKKISFISYSFGILIVMLIILYLLVIIYGIYLLVILKKDKYYKDYIHYFYIYCFIILNIFIGISLFFIFIFVLCCSKNKESIRQKKIQISEEKINNVKHEIKEAFDQYHF
jgi:hypothetical protein